MEHQTNMTYTSWWRLVGKRIPDDGIYRRSSYSGLLEVNRSLLIICSVGLLLIGASIGYGATRLVGDNGTSASNCQAAVDYFRAVDAFIDSERTSAIAVLLRDSDVTVVDQWRSAFNHMREECS